MKQPSMAQLLEAVRERMDQAVDRPVGGFEARVIRNVVAIIEREVELGGEISTQRESLLAAFGAQDDESLAGAIRQGELDARAAELRTALLGLAEAQLRIDNPRWL